MRLDAADAGHRLHHRRHALRVALDASDDDIRSDRPFQIGRRALRHDSPLVDDADSLRQLVGLFQVLRGQEDSDAQLLVQTADLGPDSGAARGVEAGGRLVQKKDLGVVNQCSGKVETALHSP